HVTHDFQDSDLLVVRQVRALAGVDVDRQRDGTLPIDPADVRAEPVLVDAAIDAHRQDRGRDQAVEVERHWSPDRSFRVGASQSYGRVDGAFAAEVFSMANQNGKAVRSTRSSSDCPSVP